MLGHVAGPKKRLTDYLWLTHGDSDADHPDHRGCGCRLCDRDNHTDVELAKKAMVHQRRGHGFDCECVACEATAQAITADEVREEFSCQKADADPQTKQYASMYALIAQERVDVEDKPMIWMQIAEIGDAVKNTAESERIAKMGDD